MSGVLLVLFALGIGVGLLVDGEIAGFVCGLLGKLHTD